MTVSPVLCTALAMSWLHLIVADGPNDQSALLNLLVSEMTSANVPVDKTKETIRETNPEAPTGSKVSSSNTELLPDAADPSQPIRVSVRHPSQAHVGLCDRVCAFCSIVASRSFSALCLSHCDNAGPMFTACLTIYTARHDFASSKLLENRHQ